MASPVTLDSLPNEMLISILSSLPTRSLLPLIEVSRRFYAIAMRILHYRLKQAAALPDHRLILECYHPSAKISTPYLFCDYLHTDNLSPDEANGDEYAYSQSRLTGLKGLYSHFRPVVQEENHRPRSRHQMQAQAQAETQESGEGQTPASKQPELASQDIHLDENELFSQLCTVTNLVKVGPKKGLFLSHVNVSEGVIRVWRDWLAARVVDSAATKTESESGGGGRRGTERTRDPILWADAGHNVGLRFRVIEKEVSPAQRPVMVASNEDIPVSYRMEFEELLVRTNQLLLMVEKSEVQEVSTSGVFFEPQGPLSYPVQTFFWADPHFNAVRAHWAPTLVGVGTA